MYTRPKPTAKSKSKSIQNQDQDMHKISVYLRRECDGGTLVDRFLKGKCNELKDIFINNQKPNVFGGDEDGVLLHDQPLDYKQVLGELEILIIWICLVRILR